MPVLTEQSVPSTETRAGSDLSQRHYRLLLIAITALAALLRLWHLGTRGFFIDEGYSWAIAKLPWHEFLQTLVTRTGEMPLHYIVMKLWIVFGESEFVLRIPSAICGIVLVPLVAETGKTIYSRRAGIFAAAFISVHLFAIKYAQEARTYPIVLMLIAAGWLCLARAVQNPTRRNWIWFSLFATLTVYSHLIAVFGVVGQYLTLLLVSPKKLGWRRVGESVLLTGLGLSPAILYAVLHKTDLEWIQPTKLPIFLELLDNLSGRSEHWSTTAVVFILFAVVTALFISTLTRYRLSWRAWTSSVPVVGVVGPIFAAYLFSINQPIFVTRYLAFVLVPLLLGLAWLCSQLSPKSGLGSAAILMAMFCWPLHSYYQERSCDRDIAWEDFRSGTAYVIQHQQSGDSIIALEGMARPAIEYYGSRTKGFPEFIYPKSADHFQASDLGLRPDPYTLPQILAKAQRVWIVYRFEKSPEEYPGIIPIKYVRRTLLKTHHLASVQVYTHVRVEEFLP